MQRLAMPCACASCLYVCVCVCVRVACAWALKQIAFVEYTCTIQHVLCNMRRRRRFVRCTLSGFVVRTRIHQNACTCNPRNATRRRRRRRRQQRCRASTESRSLVCGAALRARRGVNITFAILPSMRMRCSMKCARTSACDSRVCRVCDVVVGHAQWPH